MVSCARSLLAFLPAVAVLVLSLIERSEASHFRYGTISNIPLGENTRQPGSDSANDCNPAGDGLCEKVQFQLQAAFRRNYKWGRYFAEQWRQGYDPDCGTGCGSNVNPDLNVYSDNVAYGEVADETDWHGGPEDANGAVNYYNNNPQYDEGFAGRDTNDNDLLNENFYIRFPAYNGEAELVDARAQYKATENHADLIPAGGFIVPCPGPFTCDELKYDEDTYEWVNNTDSEKCASRQGGTGDADNPYDYSAGADSCAAWSLLYGMYLGDGTSMTIELTAEEIDYSDSQTGNFIKGTTFFFHYYEVDTSDPFVAFFTGGQRIYECSSSDYMNDEGECANDPTEQGLYYQLNNNAEARFRLEIEIWIRSDYYNRSPIATQIPTIPVLSPSTESDVLSKFQIAAYDPDDDDLFFDFGDEYEMGGTARSKEDVYPWSTNLEALALATGDQEVYEGGYNAETGQASGSGYGFNQYGDFNCNSDSKTVLLYGRCMQDRQPRQPYGVRTIDGGASFTSVVPGLVEWNTWQTAEGVSTKLRRGYYNMVVMVRDVIPYDENDPSVNAEELYAWHDTASSSDGSTATSEEMYATSTGRWSQGIPFRVKVPVDFMIYLYEGPLYFCNKGCKDNKWADNYGTDVVWENGVMYENARSDNYGDAAADSVYDASYAGLPTFANANGVYGTTIDPYSSSIGGQTKWPYLVEKDLDDLDDEGLAAMTYGNDEIQGYKSPLHMACTICGMGVYYNYSRCSPQTSECGVLDGDTLVPSEASCIENVKPDLMSDGMVSDPWNQVGAADADVEYLDTPSVEDWRDQQRIAECSSTDTTCLTDTYKGAVEVNYLFGEDVYFWITAYDFDDCTHLRVLTTGLPKGPPDEAGTDTYNNAEFSEPLFETDYASWSDTDCVTEGTTGDTEGKATCPRENPHASNNHPTGVKVRRLFMWEAVDNSRTSTGGDWTLDERPRLSSVCFYATDDYRVTYDPFYCVRIIFSQPREILYWMDQRDWLAADTKYLGNTPFNNTCMYVAVGETLEFTMSALQAGITEEGSGLDIYITQGNIPENALFGEYSTDIFEADTSASPSHKLFQWTPEEGQQCEYFICFMTKTRLTQTQYADGMVDSFTVLYETYSEDPDCSGGADWTTGNSKCDERCYTIVVTDMYADFDVDNGLGGFITADEVIPTFDEDCGLSQCVWFWPSIGEECQGADGDDNCKFQPLLTSGYTLAGKFDLDIVHQLAFNVDSDAGKGYVSYHDYNNDLHLSSDTYMMVDADHPVAPMQWHYTCLTIAPDGELNVYVDGVELIHWTNTRRDFHNYSMITGEVQVNEQHGAHVVGTIMRSKPGASGHFYMGSYMQDASTVVPYSGYMSDVRVWSRALSAEEVLDRMFRPLVVEEEVALEGWWKLNDGASSQWVSGPKSFQNDKCEVRLADDSEDEFDLSNFNPNRYCKLYDYCQKPDESLFIVSSSEFPLKDWSTKDRHAYWGGVGTVTFRYGPTPVSPTCPDSMSPRNVVHQHGGTTVTMTGSMFAKSEWLKVDMGGEILPATWVDERTITFVTGRREDVCDVPVETSNSGKYYSDFRIPLAVMQQGLDFNGVDEYVEADNVMDDFDSVKYGWSSGGWFYPRQPGDEDYIIMLFKSNVPCVYAPPSPPPPFTTPPSPPRHLLHPLARLPITPPPSPPPADDIERRHLLQSSQNDIEEDMRLRAGIGMYYTTDGYILYVEALGSGYGDTEHTRVYHKGTVKMDPDEWHFFMVTVSAEGQAHIYVDGQLDVEFTISTHDEKLWFPEHIPANADDDPDKEYAMFNIGCTLHPEPPSPPPPSPPPSPPPLLLHLYHLLPPPLPFSLPSTSPSPLLPALHLPPLLLLPSTSPPPPPPPPALLPPPSTSGQ
ncbi:hypothetical protein CYMTET_9470 [Cymbomonas tetramitiformis]|uniref:IPT/TIG domain-containing protein n=1 Tax=Cymbomonas tetramitiformis TaxID=36881 RepID=A0AAE0GRF5_9CHLO|nr:hypothetical protein CYMTET_9470 [Cymbomonas tetramitiformis]